MTDPAAYDEFSRALADAKDLQAKGRAEDADTLYRRALELAPDNAEVLFYYGAFRRECGDPKTATQLLNRVVARLPDAVTACLELTRAQHDLADWPECVAAAGRTLDLDADCIEAELMRATALFAQHDNEAATGSIERVAEKLPPYSCSIHAV